MKNIIIVLILFGFVRPALCDDFTVRGLKWGMSRKEAKSKILDAKYISGTHRKVDNSALENWQGNVLDMNALISAFFVDDQLYFLDFKMLREHSNENDWINDYYKLKEALSKKYGKPQKDHTLWRNTLYQDDHEKHGFAVSLGHLTLAVFWLEGNTRIGCMLRGENYKCELHLDYTNIPLQEKAKKRIEKIRKERTY